jgi:hypothetical protein
MMFVDSREFFMFLMDDLIDENRALLTRYLTAISIGCSSLSLWVCFHFFVFRFLPISGQIAYRLAPGHSSSDHVMVSLSDLERGERSNSTWCH